MNAWTLADTPGTWQNNTVEPRQLEPTDVRIALRASALNHLDLWIAQGKPAPPNFPHVGGADGAGVIEAVGSAVREWAPGDEVVINPGFSRSQPNESPVTDDFEILGENAWGTFAETVDVPAHTVYRKPGQLDWNEAAAFPLVTVTAWRMLRRAELTAREQLLVIGGGGVSAAAIGLGRHLGADITVATRSPAKHERLHALGATVIAVDDIAKGSAHVVVDTVGEATWASSLAALKRGGRLATCGATSGGTVALKLQSFFWNQHTLIGSTMGSQADFREVLGFIDAGLRPVIDSVYPFTQLDIALAALAAGNHIGKIVISHELS